LKVDPYSTEIRYTLDLLSYALQKLQPRSVRIGTQSIELAMAVVRRIGYQRYSLMVENRTIQKALTDYFEIDTVVLQPSSNPVDAAIFPFSLEEGLSPAEEVNIVIACRNSLSYKSLLYPGLVKGTVYSIMSKVQSSYSLEPLAGLFSPRSIFWWSFAKLVERLNSTYYFQIEDIALSRLIDFGAFWRLSYIVIFTGRSTKSLTANDLPFG
jgi:hypothetical protein